MNVQHHSIATIVVLSGLIGSGKSSLAEMLRPHGCEVISTSKLLRERAGKDRSREGLRSLGDALEKQRGAWMAADVGVALVGNGRAVVDCSRSASMVRCLREAFAPMGARVLHVHLCVSPENSASRAGARGRAGDTVAEVATASALEHGEMAQLASIADLTFDTDRLFPEDIAVIVAANMQRFDGVDPRAKLCDVIVGGQYGSEGKGHVVSRIAHRYAMLLRVGGPNAGHSVISPVNGDKVSFYHLPSGVLHSNGMVLLGAGAVIRSEVLMKELAACAAHSRPVDHRLMIDRNAVVISDDDVANEASLVRAIGSTGQGVGEATVARVRRNGSAMLAGDHPVLRRWVGDTRGFIEESFAKGCRALMEGTQGTGLSLYHGPYPFVTSRDTTATGTLAEMGIPAARVDRTIMVCRTNPIRVQSPDGATSGPMARETTWAEIAQRSGIDCDELVAKEMTTTTKRRRRVAEFDFQQLARASALNAPTDIALTFVDYITVGNRNATRYDQLSRATHAFIENIETVSGARVSYISTGFGPNTVIVR